MRPVQNTIIVTTAVYLFAGVAQASSVTLDFEEFASSGGGSGSIGFSYADQGFSIAMNPNLDFGLGYWTPSDADYIGSIALASQDFGGRTTLTRDGGERFGINSIDLARLFRGDDASVLEPSYEDFGITFSAQRSSGEIISQTFVVAGLGSLSAQDYALETFAFGGAFNDIVSLWWNQGAFSSDYGGSTAHQFDNIALSLPGDGAPIIPLPSAGALAAAGLVIVARRRR